MGDHLTDCEMCDESFPSDEPACTYCGAQDGRGDVLFEGPASHINVAYALRRIPSTDYIRLLRFKPANGASRRRIEEAARALLDEADGIRAEPIHGGNTRWPECVAALRAALEERV